MNQNNFQESVPVYASESTYQTPAPTTQEQNTGVVPLDTLPASWWNALWQATAKNNNASKVAVDNLRAEVISVLTDAGISLSDASTTQLLTAIKTICQRYATALIPGAVVSSSDIKQVSVSPTDGTMTVNAMSDWVGTKTIEERVSAAEEAVSGGEADIEAAIESIKPYVDEQTAKNSRIYMAPAKRTGRNFVEFYAEVPDGYECRVGDVFILQWLDSAGTYPFGGTVLNLYLPESDDLLTVSYTSAPDPIQNLLAVAVTRVPNDGGTASDGVAEALTGDIESLIESFASTTTPVDSDVTAVVGTSTKYARADHRHRSKVLPVAAAASSLCYDTLYYNPTNTPATVNNMILLRNGAAVPISGATTGTHALQYTPYLLCTTAAGTAAKTVDLSGSCGVLPAAPTAGTKIRVRFSNANTAASPTLRLGVGTWTGNIAIRIPGDTRTAYNPAELTDIVELVYTGQAWEVVSARRQLDIDLSATLPVIYAKVKAATSGIVGFYSATGYYDGGFIFGASVNNQGEFVLYRILHTSSGLDLVYDEFNTIYTQRAGHMVLIT